MSGKTKKNIVYGTKNLLSEDEFKPENMKIRVTTFVDFDIIKELKKRSAATGTKYQTLLNQILRDYVSGTSSEKMDEKRVRQIVREELKKLS